MVKLFLTLFINFLPVDVKHILTTYSICKESMFLKLSAGSSRISLDEITLCKKDDLLINNYNYNYFLFIRTFNGEEHNDIKKEKIHLRRWTALTINLANDKIILPTNLAQASS